MTGYPIDQLHLSPHAKRAAELVLADHPDVLFTSGRRDVRTQAAAMATNTIRYGVGWLGQTYKNQSMVQELEQWMEEHLDQTASVKAMTEGFYASLVSGQAGALTQFPHCRGDAFDIHCPQFEHDQIDERAVNAMVYTIQQLPFALGLEYVTSREGAHRVIHAQFKEVRMGEV